MTAPPAGDFAVSRLPAFGEPAPFFVAASDHTPAFAFDTIAGRWVVLSFFGSLGIEAARAAQAEVLARRDLFDDADAMFFGVSIDSQDRTAREVRNQPPGVRYFWDFDTSVSRAYGVSQPPAYAPTSFLLDRALRVVASCPLPHTARLLDLLETAIQNERLRAADQHAPVLTIPRVFEPDFCRRLIEAYERGGGTPSGVMRETEGMTVPVMDGLMKNRRDLTLQGALRQEAAERLQRRLLPMIRRAFGWRATRTERYLVACYDSAEGGFFRAHRDNTTAGTAHRKFAVTINLNADFDGGALRFPEFGSRLYRPPAGGATVFGCSLLHEATPVTRGVRYAFLPFLYDEEGVEVRQANKRFLVAPAPASDPVQPAQPADA